MKDNPVPGDLAYEKPHVLQRALHAFPLEDQVAVQVHAATVTYFS